MKVAVVGGGELGVRLAVRAGGSGAVVTGIGIAGPPERWPEGATWQTGDAGEVLAANLVDADALVILAAADDGSDGRRRIRGALQAVSAYPKACRRLVYWGPHRVYAMPAAPERPRTEAAELVERGPYRDWAEVDREVRALGQSGGPFEVVQFRAVPVLGRGIDRWLRELETLPLVTVPRARDPLQLLHADDAIDMLWRACTVGHPGVYNAASDGLLFRSRVARWLGHVPLPVSQSLAGALLAPGRLIGRPASLRRTLAEAYEPVVVDNARLKTHFGYRPRRPARTALREARDG